VTFFVDRDLGPRVGRALREVKVDVVLHADRFTASESDAVWIRSVSADGLVILTRDRHIRRRPAERQAFEDAGARCFVVATGASTPLDDVRALLIAWPLILEHVASTPAPFMYGIARDGRLTQYIPTGGPAGPASRGKRGAVSVGP
jgi:hypothetical protein